MNGRAGGELGVKELSPACVPEEYALPQIRSTTCLVWRLSGSFLLLHKPTLSHARAGTRQRSLAQSRSQAHTRPSHPSAVGCVADLQHRETLCRRPHRPHCVTVGCRGRFDPTQRSQPDQTQPN